MFDFIKARFGERSSRIQLVGLTLTVAVILGVITVDQLNTWITKLLTTMALATQLGGVLIPDGKAPVVPDGVEDAVKGILPQDTRDKLEQATNAVGDALGLGDKP